MAVVQSLIRMECFLGSDGSKKIRSSSTLRKISLNWYVSLKVSIANPFFWVLDRGGHSA